jgi:hypothetical protein
MKDKHVKKLVLSRETVAYLQEKDLKKVAGGTWVSFGYLCNSKEFFPEDTHCVC